MKQIYWLASLFLCLSFCGCNKDELVTDGSQGAPSIIFDDESGGIYTVKTGRELTVSPVFKNVEDAIITWTLNGKIVCREQSYTAVWQDLGEHYVKVKAVNSAGKAEEEIRVDVVELTPPAIELKVPAEGLKIVVNTEYTFEPVFAFDDLDGFKVEWLIDDIPMGTGRSLVWHPTELGKHSVVIRASNADGNTEKELEVEVVETVPYKVNFPTPSYFQTSTVRYTFAGRPVFLRPYLQYFENPTFSWKVNGEEVECSSQMYKFVPAQSGRYTVTVIAKDGFSGTEVAEDVVVDCVTGTEMDRLRPASTSSSYRQAKVYEYVPAPGQFIGESRDFPNVITDIEEANAWAESRLERQAYVSLGSLGGYVVVGFDHSIPVKGLEYDFAVIGNAFSTSNEPGVVWVMQDINGNGLPDDEWYELRGSETGKDETRQMLGITYFRPALAHRNVPWVDTDGNTGSVEYNTYHIQDSYYPTWIKNDSYTLYGTKLASHNKLDPATGYWSNEPYLWGYADNIGTDCLGGDSWSGSGQRNGFKISNAMYADLTTVPLKYIDFIKVQSGVCAISGALGEISTEVFGFQDLSILPSKSNIKKTRKQK
ncbi:MAG: cell surface protein [Prevotella sp.]|nr:cell surface protein [Prevotella sp.]